MFHFSSASSGFKAPPYKPPPYGLALVQLKVKEAAEKAFRSLKDLKVEYETLTKKYYVSPG
jgi:hypothetical protein